MFLTKKSILKDGSLLPILLQSETMLLFPRYFLGSRRTLENLFVRIERAWDGVVFDTKNFCGQSLCVCRRALEIFIKFDFFRYAFWGIVWRTGSESRNIQLRHSALLSLVWKGLGFIAKIFLAGLMSLTGYTRRYYLHWCRRNLCNPFQSSPVLAINVPSWCSCVLLWFWAVILIF